MNHSNISLARNLFRVARMDRNVGKLLIPSARTHEPQNKVIVERYESEVVALLSEVYSQTELQHAIDFYSSSAGQSYLEKSQTVAKRIAKIISQLVEEKRNQQ